MNFLKLTRLIVFEITNLTVLYFSLIFDHFIIYYIFHHFIIYYIKDIIIVRQKLAQLGDRREMKPSLIEKNHHVIGCYLISNCLFGCKKLFEDTQSVETKEVNSNRSLSGSIRSVKVSNFNYKLLNIQ